LAKKFNGEIVSADSQQIYQEMDIGTAKPKNTNIPYHLIDVIKPNEQFTVALFKRKAIKIIKNIQKRGKLPFLVGGTGLYISSIVDNLKIPRVEPNYKLRMKLEKLPKDVLWQKLLKLDKNAAKIVDKNNPRRIIRAIEICQATKKSLSEVRKTGKPFFEILQIGLSLSRPQLYQRINKRVGKMLEDGLLSEAKHLYQKYGDEAPGLEAIGYKEMISYLKGEITFDESHELIKRNTRHYGKRQIQWFKRDKKIFWIRNREEAEALIKNFLKFPEPV